MAGKWYDGSMNIEQRGLEDFKPGIYLHYKGQLYEADHLIRDANDNTRVGVHYIGLNVDGAQDGPRHMVRTWEDWRARIHADGTTCEECEGGVCLKTGEPTRERFRFVGAFYTASMLELMN